MFLSEPVLVWTQQYLGPLRFLWNLGAIPIPSPASFRLTSARVLSMESSRNPKKGLVGSEANQARRGSLDRSEDCSNLQRAGQPWQWLHFSGGVGGFERVKPSTTLRVHEPYLLIKTAMDSLTH